MFRDLRQMVPEHVELEILDDGWMFRNGLLMSASTSPGGMTLCDLAEKVVGQNLDRNTNEALVDRYIAELAK